MQEIDFDTQVKLKMGELKFIPSPAVWDNIELQLKKDKRNKRILILLPIFLICILYGGYILMETSNMLPGKMISKNQKKSEKPGDLMSSEIQKENAQRGYVPETTKVADSLLNFDTAHIYRGIKKAKDGSSIAAKRKLHDRSGYHARDHKSKVKNLSDSENKISTGIAKDEDEDIVVNDKPSTTELPEETIPLEKESISVSRSDTTNNNDSQMVIVAGLQPMIDKKKSEKNKSELNVGFFIAGGLSGKSIELFAGHRNNSSIPSPIKSDLSFITGLSIEKEMATKFILTTGLNYKLMATKNAVGADSAGYFASTNTSSLYNNNYHYVELPVGIKMAVANIDKRPFYISAGLGIAKFLTADALQFNDATGLYYHDNSLFKKLQVNFNSALEFEFLAKGKNPFLIGLYYSYGLSNVSGSGYNKYKLQFLGIRGQYFFRRK